jgi:type II secretory pathway pseudopilin PulG
MIEIMLVLALIGLVMAVVVLGLRKKTRDAQIQIARFDVQQLSGLFLNHRVANAGECPSIKQWLEDKTLKSEPKDPWGHPLVITCPGEHDEGGADILSPGPDGETGNDDDIESWKLQ